jgi:hypothetical protein
MRDLMGFTLRQVRPFAARLIARDRIRGIDASI